MKNSNLILTFFPFFPFLLSAQLPMARVIDGIVRTTEPGMKIVPEKNKYAKVADSLDNELKTNPSDTTSLFFRALIYYSYNQMLAAPYQRTKGTLENLTRVSQMIENLSNWE
jgi:hypothetical protein